MNIIKYDKKYKIIMYRNMLITIVILNKYKIKSYIIWSYLM